MNSQVPKTIIAVLIVIAALSLTMNLILFLRLRQSNEQVENLKTAYGRIAREQRQLKNQLKSRLPLPPQESKATGPAPPISQQDQPAASPDSALQSPTEAPKKLREDADINRDANREEIRYLLTEALAADFPELGLNQAELQELTDTVISFRESMEDLRDTQRSSDNVETIKNLLERHDQAMLDFERITGMSLVEFMRRAPAEGGIDRE